jgi:Ca-activated chloride channel family protein
MRESHGDQSKGRHRRFDSAMESLEKFLHHRKGDAFGLTIFSRNFIHWVPLTLDTETIMLSRPFIEPNVLPDELWGGTFIGNALTGASAHLAQRPAGDRMIILLTDGESPDIKSPKDVPIIADLREKGVIVFAVLLTDIPVDPALIGIARATGGEAFNAVTPEALNSVFKRIDEMKKVVVLEKKPRTADYFDPLFLPALGLLAAAVFALFGLRFTPW